MKRKKTQEKKQESRKVLQKENPSPLVLLDELVQSPKEKANNVAHLVSYLKKSVRYAQNITGWHVLVACNVHVDLVGTNFLTICDQLCRFMVILQIHR